MLVQFPRSFTRSFKRYDDLDTAADLEPWVVRTRAVTAATAETNAVMLDAMVTGAPLAPRVGL